MRKPSSDITTSVLAPWAEGLELVDPKPGRVNKLVVRLMPDGRKIPARIARSINDIGQHFWERVLKTDSCWLWQGSKDSYGYGTLRVNRMVAKAHRVAFYIANGYLPTNQLVCHKCDNPACCNPDHLFLGDDKANHDDCIRKARWDFYGEKSPLSKLTSEQVLKIRERFNMGGVSKSQLARDYGVSYAQILQIIQRKCWRHI